MEMVHWTPEALERLRTATNTALSTGEHGFAVDGFEFVTSYAVHLVEYLDEMFRIQPTIH
jgi:hypothetical protein